MTALGTQDVGNHTATVPVARDIVLLLARIGLGVLMVAHAKLEYDFAGGSIAGSGRCSRSPVSRWRRSLGRRTCCSSSSAVPR